MVDDEECGGSSPHTPKEENKKHKQEDESKNMEEKDIDLEFSLFHITSRRFCIYQ